MTTSMQETAALSSKIQESVASVIVGKTVEISAVVACLLAGGHLLLDDLPGTGKTMLARSLAASLGGEFRRVQATPDLLPNDVTGVNVYDPRTSDFRFRPGPVFANVLLADEVNRATPRTQSALLEAMAEHQVTTDGETRLLPDPFIVIATQNPVEFEGTFPLPEAQLDRFLMSLSLGYPNPSEEAGLVRSIGAVHPVEEVTAVVDPETISSARNQTASVEIGEEVADLIVAIVGGTRRHPAVSLPASPRASLALASVARASAAMDGRDFASPDDVKRFVQSTLAHRLGLTADARLRGNTTESVVDEVVGSLSMGVRDIAT